MKVLVTGADGFVGSWLLPRLRQEGHEVIAANRPGGASAAAPDPATLTVPLELTDGDSVRRALAAQPDAVVHLAAVASGSDAGRDPAYAWLVNAVGTARVADELGRTRLEGRGDPLLLVASTGEVYGTGAATSRTETDPVQPVSAYAASKLGAEIAALEVQRRTGLRVIVVRAFPHTGRGQDERFVVPAFARRLLLAKRVGAPLVEVGNLEVVREFMHVSDVVEAYCRLLSAGVPGEVYNVASGVGVRLGDVFARLAEIVGHRAVAEASANLVRRVDIPFLVGDGAKLRAATGWRPVVSLEDTLTEVVHAQAN